MREVLTSLSPPPPPIPFLLYSRSQEHNTTEVLVVLMLNYCLGRLILELMFGETVKLGIALFCKQSKHKH